MQDKSQWDNLNDHFFSPENLEIVIKRVYQSVLYRNDTWEAEAKMKFIGLFYILHGYDIV